MLSFYIFCTAHGEVSALLMTKLPLHHQPLCGWRYEGMIIFIAKEQIHFPFFISFLLILWDIRCLCIFIHRRSFLCIKLSSVGKTIWNEAPLFQALDLLLSRLKNSGFPFQQVVCVSGTGQVRWQDCLIICVDLLKVFEYLFVHVHVCICVNKCACRFTNP